MARINVTNTTPHRLGSHRGDAIALTAHTAGIKPAVEIAQPVGAGHEPNLQVPPHMQGHVRPYRKVAYMGHPGREFANPVAGGVGPKGNIARLAGS